MSDPRDFYYISIAFPDGYCAEVSAPSQEEATELLELAIESFYEADDPYADEEYDA